MTSKIARFVVVEVPAMLDVRCSVGGTALAGPREILPWADPYIAELFFSLWRENPASSSPGRAVEEVSGTVPLLEATPPLFDPAPDFEMPTRHVDWPLPEPGDEEK